MKNIILVAIAIILFASLGYCQDTQEMVGQVAKAFTGSDSSGNDLIAGFSLGGLIAGILFGCIGFVAFMFGKKNSEFRPMVLGILLMVYPYFIKNTIAMYLVGIALTATLFVWRE